MSDWSQATPDSIKRGKAPWVILELLFPGVPRSSFPLGKRSHGWRETYVRASYLELLVWAP